MSNKTEVLGVDFGDTIWREADETLGGVFDPLAVGFLDPAAVPALMRLSRERFAERIWVVSMCREAAEDEVRRILAEEARLWLWLDLPEPQIRFCRRHEDKAEICRELGITHFVDDRPNVLREMEHVVDVRIEITLPGLERKHPAIDRRGMLHAQGWPHVLRMLLPRG